MNGQVRMQEPSGCVQGAKVLTGTETRKFIIYKVTNQVNGKIYIGQTGGTLAKRRSRHIRDSFSLNSDRRNRNQAIHCAIRKYGADSFIFETLCHCLSKDAADEKEREFIKSTNSTSISIGYNRTYGGEGWLGWKHTEEVKARMRGRKVTEESKAKMRANWNTGGRIGAHTGHKHTDETKEKCRAAATLAKLSKEGRAKLAARMKIVMTGKKYFLGRTHTDEARAKISASMKAMWLKRKEK